ncbi:ADP-ribosylation factor-like protein 2-binding protein [Orchesella cincta]|uniref:ADP-ribosylation factor-like protein 2-binding protein n=1 Tax=Orchesella cincta TaxID=48709 RepID=A0A1D2ML91_ORCCI|nr:ADP-ribosylation factor-like protein 2-binding protein [Orchesella cincta]
MATESKDAEASDKFNEAEFVKIVGLVEDILVDEDFQTRQTEYFSRHWKQFADENDDRAVPLDSSELQKLSTERFNIFRTYSIEMGGFLESELKRSLGEEFEIQDFLHEVELRTKQNETLMAQEKGSSGDKHSISPRVQQQQQEFETDGEIVDMLLTLRDFGRFQELMVDYSKMMQGKTPDMDGLVSYRKISDDEAETI